LDVASTWWDTVLQRTVKFDALRRKIVGRYVVSLQNAVRYVQLIIYMATLILVSLRELLSRQEFDMLPTTLLAPYVNSAIDLLNWTRSFKKPFTTLNWMATVSEKAIAGIFSQLQGHLRRAHARNVLDPALKEQSDATAVQDGQLFLKLLIEMYQALKRKVPSQVRIETEKLISEVFVGLRLPSQSVETILSSMAGSNDPVGANQLSAASNGGCLPPFVGSSANGTGNLVFEWILRFCLVWLRLTGHKQIASTSLSLNPKKRRKHCLSDVPPASRPQGTDDNLVSAELIQPLRDLVQNALLEESFSPDLNGCLATSHEETIL
jgi:hypothetical protein